MLGLPKTVSRPHSAIGSKTRLLGPKYGIGWFLNKLDALNVFLISFYILHVIFTKVEDKTLLKHTVV